MKHIIEKPNPTFVLLRAVIIFDRPLCEIEQTNRGKISKTPMKYALASFSKFMKCSEVMNIPPSNINDIYALFFNDISLHQRKPVLYH